MAALQDPSKIAGTEAGQEPAGLHKQLLDQKNGKQGDTYVSPSDAIMSPASQKLQGFKQRQINKQRFVTSIIFTPKSTTGNRSKGGMSFNLGGKNQTSRLLFSRTPSGNEGGADEQTTEQERS
ncbi:hypothetical protein D0869_08735 [Hortaea werneckii]|uniref:Uncharacterized protein n=1 Tax=Hortaea werneckii TaxID=91943 RepID=A0A3M6WKF1_HORWE|nr:hypothetical protein KC334_g14272 [Hortaea werneckii]KAI6990282.1 hypothetical protein KC355_g10425 [Hortaea werneckii]KAI7181351.1 hypothetical protein KC324_g8694 [Hortaea werneckii]KAI7582638.1 hypothetical protein KC316_g7747 [Hortaea werneckii]KAI7662057.1 hypothetical protein KC318_g9090 [Hortaea werneckii]